MYINTSIDMHIIFVQVISDKAWPNINSMIVIYFLLNNKCVWLIKDAQTEKHEK